MTSDRQTSAETAQALVRLSAQVLPVWARQLAGSRAQSETAVTEMLAWVGLADRASARPATLSGGEQQRVAIARAVIGRPEMLVADEPTGNVDPEMAARLMHLFKALNKLGTTVVVATHDVHLLNSLPGVQLMRLDRGRIADPVGLLKYPPGKVAPKSVGRGR